MEEARKDGIVENIGSSGNYRCKLCKTECPVIPMMAHLKGEKHKNNLIFKILQEPTRKWHSDVTSGIEIPGHIRMAARSKKIDVDVQQKQIHCCICVSRTTVNGLTTLIQHFESHSIQTDGTHAPRSDLSFVAASPPAANGPRNTGIMQGQLETNLRLGIIINENGSQTQFRCTICDSPISGSEQAEAHLAGSQHRRKLTANNTSVTSHLPQAPIAGPSVGATHDRELLRKAIRSGELQINGNIYTCNICQAYQMTEAPALQHINGKVHKKLTEAPVVSSANFAYDRKRKKAPHGDTGRIGILSRAFYVLVFNNIFRDHPERKRKGAQYDSENIKRVFGKLNCIIDIQEDKTKAETENIIKNLTERSVLQKVKKLICFILSHGAKGFYIQTCDEEKPWMHIDNIRLAFKDSRCQALIGKPKIFFVNSCRGKYSEKPFETDGERETDAPNEMVTYYACINGYRARRDTPKGTRFVLSVCQTIEEYPNAKLVEEFNLKLIQKMKENGGGTIESQGYAFTNSDPLLM